ncbi:hypothetical protein HNP33_003685 [Comamonas odontotermitis]|uniref:Uncharacterized protein n=1 Tax=Comamonas odontotermitis TaxID=379895 RepID=A0ABR6RKA4_9BURK|nr:hypothetical protein [Comamonas odontotermitis]
MIGSRYCQWHIKPQDQGIKTPEHERADTIKPSRPEAMPVLGSMIWRCAPTPAEMREVCRDLGPDVPF